MRDLADDKDPGDAETWRDRRLEPVELAYDPASASDAADTTPPDLIAFEIGPPSGTSPDDPTVVVRARIADARSGIGGGGSSSPSQARIRSRSGQMRDVLFIPSTRISGTELDGTNVSSFTLDEHAEKGLWQVEYVMLVDNAGNRQTIPGDVLAARGFLTSVVVR